MALPTIFKDTDVTLEITATDENDVVINLTLLSGYVVIVFQGDIEFQKFSKNVQVGFSSILETDAVNGVFRIHINGANTQKGRNGANVQYELKILAVNAEFDSSTEEKSGGPKDFAILQETDLKNTTFV